MTTGRFTKEQFENALPRNKDTGEPLWELLSSDPDFTYSVPVLGTNKRIVIRSTVNPATKVAGAAGQDLIRVWIEYRSKNTWYALGKDDIRWTQQTPGWEKRLDKRIRDAWTLAIRDSNRRAVQASRAKEAKAMTAKTENADLDVFVDAVSERTPVGKDSKK